MLTNPNLIGLPKTFWLDRKERDLPMPKAVGWSKTQCTVDAADPALADYLDSSRDIAGQTEQLWSNAFTGMEDALVDFAVNRLRF